MSGLLATPRHPPGHAVSAVSASALLAHCHIDAARHVAGEERLRVQAEADQLRAVHSSRPTALGYRIIWLASSALIYVHASIQVYSCINYSISKASSRYLRK